MNQNRYISLTTLDQLQTEFGRVQKSPENEKAQLIEELKQRAEQLAGQAAQDAQANWLAFIEELRRYQAMCPKPATPAPAPRPVPNPAPGGDISLFNTTVILLLLVIAGAVLYVATRKVPDTASVEATVKNEVNTGLLRQMKLGGAGDKVEGAIRDRAFAQLQSYKILGAVTDALKANPNAGATMATFLNAPTTSTTSTTPKTPANACENLLADHIRNVAGREKISDAILQLVINDEKDEVIDQVFASLLQKAMTKEALTEKVTMLVKLRLAADPTIRDNPLFNEVIEGAVVQADPYKLLFESKKENLTSDGEILKVTKMTGARPFEGLGAKIREELKKK